MTAALWCKSNFSFLEGASHPDELIAQAANFELPAIALTDRDGVHGVVRAHGKALELGVRLLIGSEVTIDDGSTIVLLALDRAGYGGLCRLLTAGRRRSPKGSSRVAWSEVCEHAAGLLALWGGARALLAGAPEPDAIATALREAFGDRLYAMVARHRRPEELVPERRLRERARRFGLPTVAANETLYHAPSRRRLQDVLTATRHGVDLASAGRLLRPSSAHALLSPPALRALFADDPASIERAREVAARARFSLADLRYRYPSETLADGTTSSQRLRALTFEGARKRHRGEVPDAVRAQLERELEVIDALDYCGYFLTMYDIVEFCRSKDILCQGRGSAANSAVCHCLGITAVDPVRMGLLFERFLSRERAEPPDIDLDIEHARREEVIQHVYDKYGRTHAAMVANVICYRPRSALRDVGKALGFDEATLLRLSKLVGHYDRVEGLDATTLSQARLSASAREIGLLTELANELQGFPRHLSIHPGGFLLGHEPVSTLVPIENATMERRTVIQWDKDDVEALGLFKVDLLGLGALTHLHRAFDLLREHRGIEMTLADVPPDDAETFAMIQRGDTVGVFQIESRAQMAMLPRLRPKDYYDLVIEVSIVRPGPITGGMVHPYLRRRNGEEQVTYPHECLEPVLAKTLGVPLFQEQVMRLAVVAADYTAGEADQLRRDMAAWRRSGRIGAHREKLVARMQRKGISAEFAERVFQQILGFGEYGFPESHAASFALISYAGAWLRRHHPETFSCALLNAQPMGFYSVSTIVEDAKRNGVEVKPIDVLRSGWDCTLEPTATGLALRMGARYVRGLNEAAWQRLAAARDDPEVDSIDALRSRASLDRRAIEELARAGALRGFESERRCALWQARRPLVARALDVARDEPRPTLRELAVGETIEWDHRSSHHSTLAHPLAPLRPELAALGLPDAREVARVRNGARVDYAGLVICRQRPGTASGIVFMTLEDESGFVNVIVRNDVFERFSVLARTCGFLGVTGRAQREGEVLHVLATSLWSDRLPRTIGVESHDFH